MAGNPTTPQATTRVLWRPEQFTRVSNPIFATNTTGWSVAAGVNAAGTSITRITTDSYEGSACGSLVCGATDGGGVNFDLGSNRYYRETDYGTVYIAVVWLKRTSGSRRARVTLGSEGTVADRATLLITDLVDSWAPYTVRWLPTANRTDAQLAVTNGSAQALTVKIGKATVYQVDAFSQVENGAFPVDTTGWAGFNGGSIARRTTGGFGKDPCARVTASTTASSGAYFAMPARRFVSGRTYRLRIAAQNVSGASTTWYLEFYNGSTLASTTFTAPAGWSWFTLDWTAASDYTTSTEVGIYHPAASAAVMDIDHVEVYEASDDLGNDVQSLRWTRSTDAVGTIAVQVLNHDGTYDPRNVSAALYGSLSPGKRIWGRATYGSALYPLFYGTLTTIEAPPLGGVHTDLVAEDMLGAFSRSDTFHDMDQTDTFWYARYATLNSVVTGDPDTSTADASGSHWSMETGATEGNTFYNGTDGAMPVLDYLNDLNDATGTAHHVLPDVRANIGWTYATVDRAALTDTSSDFTVDEDFADVTGVRTTHEALENRQEVPWQAYEKLPPPGADTDGYGYVMLAYDPTVYVPLGVGDADEAPYLSYQDEEYGTDDAHPEARWKYGWMTRRRWRERRKRGLKVPRRTRVYPDAFVPFTMTSGEVRRLVLDFALPVSGATVTIDGTAGATGIVVDYIESRADRLVVDLRCISDDDCDFFAVRGTPWLPLDDLTETTQGYQSQADFGVHPGPTISTAYIPSKAAAEGIGHYRDWRYGEPRLRPTLHLAVGQVATTVAVKPTDHVTLSADRWRIDALLFVVRGATWEVVTKGMEWTCQVDLEELPDHTDWLTLDHATLGLDEAVVLAY